MNYAEWIEALTIFAKYHEEGLNARPMQRARHQELAFGCDKTLISPEDKARLEELGWNDYDGLGMMHTFM